MNVIYSVSNVKINLWLIFFYRRLLAIFRLNQTTTFTTDVFLDFHLHTCCRTIFHRFRGELFKCINLMKIYKKKKINRMCNKIGKKRLTKSFRNWVVNGRQCWTELLHLLYLHCMSSRWLGSILCKIHQVRMIDRFLVLIGKLLTLKPSIFSKATTWRRGLHFAFLFSAAIAFASQVAAALYNKNNLYHFIIKLGE